MLTKQLGCIFSHFCAGKNLSSRVPSKNPTLKSAGVRKQTETELSGRKLWMLKEEVRALLGALECECQRTHVCVWECLCLCACVFTICSGVIRVAEWKQATIDSAWQVGSTSSWLNQRQQSGREPKKSLVELLGNWRSITFSLVWPFHVKLNISPISVKKQGK